MAEPADAAVIGLSGAVDIQTISQFHKQFCEAFSTTEVIVIDADALDEIDITTLQLIEAARRQAAKSAKQLSLKNPAAGDLRDALERGGFLSDDASRAFWCHEGTAC